MKQWKEDIPAFILIALVAFLVYKSLVRPDTTTQYDMLFNEYKTQRIQIKQSMDSLTHELKSAIDSIQIIEQNKTNIVNRFIGVSNEIEKISTSDSVRSYIRVILDSLTASPGFFNSQ